MTKLLAPILFVLLLGPQFDQSPPIGIIDFYGLRSTSEQQVRQALQLKEGDQLPASPVAAQRRLEALPNVRQALLGVVCCEAGKTILYVGISEKGAPTLRFRQEPKGAIRLPDNIVQAGDAFYQALNEAVLKGETGEDESQGHALNANPKMRAIQERFIAFAAQDLKLLRTVLRESADAQHRNFAAQIIAYTTHKREVVKDLLYGMSDPDSSVRNTSTRSLALFASLAEQSPEQGIKVPVESFVEMLNSIVWTDRNKSSLALYHLTEKRNPALLRKLRESALPSLIEMARWKTGHAFAPFCLLGRTGDLPEAEIVKDWESGNHEVLIDKVLKQLKAR